MGSAGGPGLTTALNVSLHRGRFPIRSRWTPQFKEDHPVVSRVGALTRPWEMAAVTAQGCPGARGGLALSPLRGWPVGASGRCPRCPLSLLVYKEAWQSHSCLQALQVCRRPVGFGGEVLVESLVPGGSQQRSGGLQGEGMTHPGDTLLQLGRAEGERNRQRQTQNHRGQPPPTKGQGSKEAPPELERDSEGEEAGLPPDLTVRPRAARARQKGRGQARNSWSTSRSTQAARRPPGQPTAGQGEAGRHPLGSSPVPG